jgi:hypothetical protein
MARRAGGTRERKSGRLRSAAVLDVLWSAWFGSEPKTVRRKWLVLALVLVSLLAYAIGEQLSLLQRQPLPVSTITESGGIHIGDNVIGQQTRNEMPLERSPK